MTQIGSTDVSDKWWPDGEPRSTKLVHEQPPEMEKNAPAALQVRGPTQVHGPVIYGNVTTLNFYPPQEKKNVMSRNNGDFTSNSDWGRLHGAPGSDASVPHPWDGVDPGLAHSVIGLCLRHKVLISFQAASDGVASGVTVLSGVLKGRSWAHDTDGITALLRDLQERYY